jgi:phage terminase small subunit
MRPKGTPKAGDRKSGTPYKATADAFTSAEPYGRAAIETLTAKRRTFINEYLIDHNATQAAVRAGYSARTANREGTRLLSNAVIAAAINSAMVKRAEKLEITAACITARLIAIADNAEAMESPSGLAVARQSLMDVAKLNGLIVETHENVTRSPEERRARLAELRAERERLTRKH